MALADTDGLLVIEETLAAGCGEKRHYHNEATQCFYIHEGTALMKIDGCNVALAQGMAPQIQAGTRYAIANESSNKIRFLVTSSPLSRSDRHEIVVKK